MRSVVEYWLGLLKSPPRLTPSEWADAFRYLSRESHHSGGKYRLEVAPYQKEPMDSCIDPTVQSTCLMWASQVGKTELLNNIVGYFIAADAAPILVVQPTLEMAEAWSKDRLVPMLRDTPQLAGLVADARSRDSGNTMLSKSYPGGSIAIAGANSPSGLASRPRRVVLLDEVDRYPTSAGTEGDPCALAERRTESFWNAVIVKTSTPTIKGVSRIEKDYEQTDQRKWFCPCPHCGHFQTLEWKQVLWPKGEPEKAYLECVNETCRAQLNDAERVAMIKKGEWRATAPFRGKRGYHLNGIYSPFKAKRGYASRLHQMASQHMEAKASGKEALKAWVNTFLAETWQDEGESLSSDPIYQRREDYASAIPDEVLVLTAGVDVQGDRIEAELVGWGAGEESWGIEYRVFMGKPTQGQVWQQLDDWLMEPRSHPNGHILRPACVCVDSSDQTKLVYEWCRPRLDRRVFPVKGASTPALPIVSRPRKPTARITMFNVGTDTAKDLIYSRLKLTEAGPGFLHFPRSPEAGYESEYFAQLVSERVVSKFKNGQRIRVWEKTRARNEALDIRVYAQAALAILNPNWAALKKHMEPDEKVEPPTVYRPAADESEKFSVKPAPAPARSPDAPKPRPVIAARPRPRQNFATGWMR